MSPVADSSVRSMGAVPSSVSCSSCPYRKAPAEVLTFAADRVLLPKISASCQCRSEDEKPLFQKHHISPNREQPQRRLKATLANPGSRKGGKRTSVAKGFRSGVAQPHPLVPTSVHTSPIVAGGPALFGGVDVRQLPVGLQLAPMEGHQGLQQLFQKLHPTVTQLPPP